MELPGITSFIEKVQQEIPLSLAMPNDPVGLQVMANDSELQGIAIAYEVTESIVETAAKAGTNLLVVFHPLIYPSLPRITPDTRVERCVISLIQHNIALYVMHTAFDAHPRGTSRLLAEGFALESITPLVPSPVLPGAGMGAIGDLSEPVSLRTLADQLRTICTTDCVRISASSDQALDQSIRRIALLGGSGMSFYDQAVEAGADAFITADVRYHAFHAANDRIPVLDPGHAESERFVSKGMADLLQSMIDDAGLSIPLTHIDLPTNPVHYITGN